MFDLTGRKALVTGATGGIGGAIARALHAQGAEVVLSGTREEKLAGLKDELGERVHVAAANLADMDEAEALPGRAAEAMGGLDVLVANAGVTADGLALRMKHDDFDRVLDVNLRASWRMAKAALKPLMKSGRGRLIGVGSVVGTTGNPGQANYAASKAGLVGMIKSLGAELGSRGLTANVIAPGFIATAMTDALNEDQRTRIDAQIPAGRMGTPEEIAAAAVYLASDEAAYVNGATLHVNGGMAMV